MKAVAALVAAGVAVTAAGCGGSSGGGVAQLGATGPATTTTSAQTGALAFSGCMRAHGVPAYPDPGTGGLLPKKSLKELGVSSAEFEAAQKACIHLVPNGGRPSPAQVAQYRTVMLGYARCMRAHGVPNMPDPDSRGHLDIGPGTPVAVNSPAFKAAFAVCKSRLSP
jgi:hypothetical protein